MRARPWKLSTRFPGNKQGEGRSRQTATTRQDREESPVFDDRQRIPSNWSIR